MTTRRRFLRNTAAAVAAPTIIPSSALGLGDRPAPSERITMAYLGYGTIAHHTIGEFLKDKRVQLIAICDPNEEGKQYGYSGELTGGRAAGKQRVDAHYGNADCRTHADFREVLAAADVDSINIATPDHWHAIMAIEGARAGKHIYGQKPLALTVDQGRKMSDAVKEAGITWQTGSQQRSDTRFRMAAEFVRNGRLGKVTTVKVGLPGGHNNWNQQADQKGEAEVPGNFDWNQWLGPAPVRPYSHALHPLQWRHNFDFSGGMITDFGAHHIDIAQWALDKEATGPVLFSEGSATLPDPGELYNTPTAFSYKATYQDGTVLDISDSHPTGCTFIGDNGRSLYVDRGKLEFTPYTLAREKIQGDEIKLYESKNHYANFIDCVYSGEECIAPIEAAHRTISIAHLGNIMLRLGRKQLKWNPDTEQIEGDERATAMLSREMRAPYSI